ncbi:hypothetical protein KEM54_005144 [Ascosphaera aggregata]|nr:hypothetical protein KEM54_005144 [Ascosphaera aggregata]
MAALNVAVDIENPSMFVYTSDPRAVQPVRSPRVPFHDCAQGPLLSNTRKISSDLEPLNEVYEEVNPSLVPFHHHHHHHHHDDNMPVLDDDTDDTSVLTLSGQTPLRDIDFNVYSSINSSIDPFSWLSPVNRALLDHFISCTTTALSCHQLIRHEITSVLVPMAAEAPYLLSSLLCLAATNRISLGLDQNTTQLDRLKATTIRQLLNVISVPEKILEDAVIACILVLCTTDIVSLGRVPDHGELICMVPLLYCSNI